MARAPLSIIIPTLNSASVLPDTINFLTPAIETGLVRELIFSDGGSEDDTKAIASAVGAKFVSGPAGRGQQLAAGADAAGGLWLLIVHSDTWLSIDWVDEVESHMTTPGLAGYFKLKYRAAGLASAWVSGWANCRSKWFGLPFGDQGLVISKDLYLEVGGYPSIPIMEDVEIARRLKGRLRMLNATAATDPCRYLEEGWFNRGLRNFLLLAKYRAGVSPEKLNRSYRKFNPQ